MEISSYSSRKRAARQRAKAAIKALSSSEKENESRAIVDHLAGELANVDRSAIVLIYAALPLEANVWEIIHRCPDLTFALPRVLDASKLLECRHFNNPNSDLSLGTYRVMEPIPEKCPLVKSSELQAIVTPGLSFSKSGARLGKGGGYYDRLLEETKGSARSIGVGFDCQLCRDIPMEPHDQYLDGVITPSGVWSA